MSGDSVVRSTCELCLEGCGVLIHLKDGKPVRVVGDPDSPYTVGEYITGTHLVVLGSYNVTTDGTVTQTMYPD